MAKTATRRFHLEPAYWQVAFRNSNGYPIGQETDPDNVVDGTTTHAYRATGVIDFSFAPTTYPVITNRGSQQIISQTLASAASYGNPTVNLSHVEEMLEAYRTTTSIDTTTNTEAAIQANNAAQRIFPTFVSLLSQVIRNEDTGQEEYLNTMILNHKINRAQEAGAVAVTGDVTNPNPTQYILPVSLSARDISGYALSSLSLSITSNNDTITTWRSDFPYGLTTYIGDAVATTCILGYRPVNIDATGKGQNNITKDGVLLPVTSVDTTTGVVTFTAAPGASEIVIILYQTQFVVI